MTRVLLTDFFWADCRQSSSGEASRETGHSVHSVVSSKSTLLSRLTSCRITAASVRLSAEWLEPQPCMQVYLGRLVGTLQTDVC